MKQHRLLWFLGLLLCASLSACSFPDIQLIFDQIFNVPHETAPVQVDSVTVLPATGTGHFDATVKYSYTDGDGIHCIVDTGQHDGETPFSHGLQGSAGPTTETFPLDIAKPGEHTLTCTGYSGNSSASDTFTVTSIEEPQSQPGDQPLTITGAGTVSGTNSWGSPYSVRTTSVLLTIDPDGSADLYVVYTMNVDYTREEYMYFDGIANPAEETVTFTTCNFEGVPTGETLSYTRLPLSAEYTCILSPKGGVQEEWKLTMP